MFSRRSLFLLVFVATSALAQTTGSVAGRVADSSGASLPGVTVEARSASLQGSRVAVSDARGEYRLALLPPGLYSVSYKLDGFAPETRKGITVSLGKETAVDIAMKPAASGEITVTAEAPVLDSSSTTVGTNFGTRAIDTLPTQRNYTSVVQVAPGVSTDANPDNNDPDVPTITVYGSSGAENSYFIDGVNTTGVEYGFQGKQLNFEFIREVNVKTGGYEAEFGRSTGGIINVITKSGGNEYSGDVFGYDDNDSLQANTKEVVASTPSGFRRSDAGVDVGGYLLKDKLWFFAAYD
ncbi:MAG TPA: TonB-dependent receptor, partial [Thermoanaerobaculia bacterium]|nr:TonB-dependent receptor [Thermoanaerobaculia bacterium]